jgi:hypothetical protein
MYHSSEALQASFRLEVEPVLFKITAPRAYRS